MIGEVVEELRHAPVVERIAAIEVLLNSLKLDLGDEKQVGAEAFTVREFDLGKDVEMDRQELYAERIVG